ncbi:polysaccharide pyruvyl transferase family protein [Legionella bononiensis]|uniref:Polysaccharide pyruvyl transferase family protein n=1 Tax=Legionella bononiensis TaxID=2793102 RepID=A0ABS1WBL1_9GAMM|nr:polysaccharide pyruvyl transferase family protein [Legionella bononiensis]MBL7481031.1 polysaccharide pyruvyl transferase family protein [Legionella bononiensis]MBL7526739.1 polysaccharide pyruvyl transferase family protein [Legionella bononiensis]MBL7564146.1 polysaccharide pyruvyl transferase family protein [Legionella bononiensis]
MMPTLKVGVMNFHFTNYNFGAVMVPYALSTLLKNLGYQPEIINYIPKGFRTSLINCPFEDFRNKYLIRTSLCKNEKDLRELNKHFDLFIAGSDQVWRWHDNYKYMFNWVSGNKTLVSYAASFANSYYECTGVEQKKIQALLSRFDAISVRENAGVDICKDLFNVDAEHVLDPTLLLDAEDYELIIEAELFEATNRNIKYIAYMLLDSEQDKAIRQNEILAFLKSKYIFINVLIDKFGQYNSISKWLDYIKNCDYLITDSFHGCVFAIIFKKQFVCVQREVGGNHRIESLFNVLGIDHNRFYNNVNDISQHSFSTPIDYKKVYQNLEKERNKSKEFLIHSLSLKPTRKLYCLGEELSAYFLKFIPFKIVKKRNKTYVRLFGKLPLIKIMDEITTIKIYLFNFIPICKISS